MSHAARNRSGPISPRSNGLTKMPSGRRASSRSRFALRIDNGKLAQIVATFNEDIERAKLDLLVMATGM